MDYTSRWKGFQFRSPVYLDGRIVKNEFDLVKWIKYDKPMEVTDGMTGEKVLRDEFCYSIGRLIWDKDEDCFDFKSIGMRYFEDRCEGLEAWIMAFAKMKEVEFNAEASDTL